MPRNEKNDRHIAFQYFVRPPKMFAILAVGLGLLSPPPGLETPCNVVELVDDLSQSEDAMESIMQARLQSGLHPSKIESLIDGEKGA